MTAPQLGIAIDWPTIMQGIQNFLVAGSKLPATSVVWNYTGAAASRPLIGIEFHEIGQISHDSTNEYANPLTFDDIMVTPDHTSGSFHAVAHARVTGDGPVNIASTLTVPGGLFVETPYWIVVDDVDHFHLADSFVHTGGNYVGNPITTLSFTDNGTGTITVVQTDDTERAGQEIERVATGIREITLEISCLGGLNSGVQPVSFLTDVIAALSLHVDELTAAGIGVTDIGVSYLAGGVRLAPQRRGSMLEPKAICDMTVYLGTEVSDFIGSVESVGMSVRMQQADGTQLAEIDLVIPHPTLVSVTVSPSSLAVPQASTGTLVATAHYNDGSSVDVTLAALWITSNAEKVTVSDGIINGVAVGSANIEADFGGLTSNVVAITVTQSLFAIWMRGQSNLEGQHIAGESTPTSNDIVPAYYRAPLTAVRMAQQISNVPANPQTFELVYADAALQPRDSSSSGYPYDQLANFGPEISMGYQMNKVGRFAIIKSAVGSSSLAVDWDPTITDSAWQVSAAFAQEKSVALGAPVCLRTWNQGETDAGNSTDAGLYETRMIAMDAADLVLFPDTPLVITLIPSSSIEPFAAEVNAGIIAFASTRPYVYVVTPGVSWFYDGLHFGASGYIHLGKAMATQACVALALTPPADPEPQTVVTDKTAYNIGDPIVVTWTGLTDPQNWINICAPGDPVDSQFGAWVFSVGSQVEDSAQNNPNGSHTFHIGPGTWCARILTDANQDPNYLLAQSTTFTIT